MNQKLLLKVSSDPVVTEIGNRMSKLKNEALNRIAFLKKQANDVKKHVDEENAKLFDELGDHLVKIGAINSYDKERDGLEIDMDEDTLFLFSAKEYREAEEKREKMLSMMMSLV